MYSFYLIADLKPVVHHSNNHLPVAVDEKHRELDKPSIVLFNPILHRSVTSLPAHKWQSRNCKDRTSPN
jgi:hypothetical protein